MIPWYLAHLAKGYTEIGRFDEATRCIDEAVATTETTKETWCEAEVYRTAGEILLLSPKPDVTNAESCFERALAVAREQQAKTWEIRTSVSLARLWRNQGRAQEARDLVCSIDRKSTEGFSAIEIKQAQALLDELTSAARSLENDAPLRMAE